MQRELTRHPASRSPIDTIVGEAFRFDDGRVQFMFLAVGDTNRVVIPPAAEPKRTNELWRRTCFEAFVRCGEAYVELNFSPSGEWAAYRFDAYRSGMAAADIPSPQARFTQVGPMLTLTTEVALGPLSDLVPWEKWQVGLSAVIKADDGTRSYWALVHPPGDPDFHHANCFVGELAPDASL